MGLPKYLWEDVINTVWYILNREVIRSILEKTSYELLKGTKQDPPPPKDEDINEDKEESSHEEDKKDTSNKLLQDWTIAKDYLSSVGSNT